MSDPSKILSPERVAEIRDELEHGFGDPDFDALDDLAASHEALRERAERAEAERDELRKNAREYLHEFREFGCPSPDLGLRVAYRNRLAAAAGVKEA